MVYSSGGEFFDEKGNPVFNKEGSVAHKMLSWLVDAINKHKIVSRTCFELYRDADCVEYMTYEKAAFASSYAHALQQKMLPRYPEEVRPFIKLAPYPQLKEAAAKGLEPTTMSYTRMYVITSHSPRKDDAWKLVEFLGGKDKHGEYLIAKRWYMNYGNFFCVESLWEDEEIMTYTNEFFDADLLRKLQSMTRPREYVKASWFGEWELENMAEIQRAFLGEISPKQALDNSADLAVKLQKNWGWR